MFGSLGVALKRVHDTSFARSTLWPRSPHPPRCAIAIWHPSRMCRACLSRCPAVATWARRCRWLPWPWSLPLADPVAVGCTSGWANTAAAAIKAMWCFSHRMSHLPQSSYHPLLSHRVTIFVVVSMLFPRARCSATAARSRPRPSGPISAPHGTLPRRLTVWVFLLI